VRPAESFGAGRPPEHVHGRPADVAGPSWALPARAPVADDRRPSGLGPVPPTGWPAPKIDGLPPGAGGPQGRSRSLMAFVAFLLGALVVGAAFASYALGDRKGRDQGASPGRSTTTVARSAGGDLDVRRILDLAQPSVVSIQTGGPQSIFGGAGSGVVISEDGLIVTNAHVIEDAGGQITVRFNDGTTSDAELVGAFTDDDVALIRVARSDLTPAVLGSSANLLVGSDVVAIGNALNLGGDPSVTRGIVSAKDRLIDDGNIKLDHLIQTDAAINPGNSGGALVNADGEVVGINTAIIQGAQNVGFSLAIDNVKDLIAQIEAGNGDIVGDQAILGVVTVSLDSPDLQPKILEDLGVVATAGALVTAVEPSSPASEAGLQPTDVILEFDGARVTGSDQLEKMVASHQPGDDVSVVFERGGDQVTRSVTLGPN
jgi:S1-C subfamily serine protease